MKTLADVLIHKKLISKFDTKSTEACGKMGRMICVKNYYQCEDCPFAGDCWTRPGLTDEYAKKIFNTPIETLYLDKLNKEVRDE